MTMSSIDHGPSTVFTGKVVVDSPKVPATVVNLDTTPIVSGLRELTVAVEAISKAIKHLPQPSVVLEPTIQVEQPQIHIPEPKVVIQRVDGQIVTQNLAVKKIHLVLLALPYVYILAEILRKIM